MMSEEIQAAVQYKPVLQSVGLNTANPLLEAASPLILLFIQLRYTQTVVDVNQLRKNIVTEINIFANQAKASHCSPHLILAARYCLCTALDEAILLTPWGSQSGWAQQSLLSLIHRETWGGERFFIILEKMAAEPKKNLLILELLYLLLSLGFEGKYYNEDRILREELLHRLYQLISYHHTDADKNLSPSLEILKSAQLKKLKKFSCLRFFSGILGALLSVGLIFNIMLYWKAKPFLQDIRDISMAHSVFISPAISAERLDKIKINPEKNLHRRVYSEHRYLHHHQHHEDLVLPPPVWGNQ